MAHDLFNGSMVYVGDHPWHGLGTRLGQNATWDEVKEKLRTYTVMERPVYAAGIGTPIPDRKALVASDDGRYIATVGADYGVVQFDDLAKALAEAVGDKATIHTAGLMGERGQRMWILCEIPRPYRVRGDVSEVRRFFMGATSHDGSLSTHMLCCDTRVVCRNTLNVALGEKSGARWSIRHTSNAAQRVAEVGKAFARILKGSEAFEELANQMASVQLNDGARQAVVERVFPMPEDTTAEQQDNVRAKREAVLALAENGTGVGAAMRGTAWAMFQGLTEWADHHRSTRTNQTMAEKFTAQTLGAAVPVKREGLAAILSVASLKAPVVRAA